jgi:hypothetical protein
MNTGDTPVLLDLRNIFTPQEVRGYGFRYQGVGRGWKGEPENGLEK